MKSNPSPGCQTFLHRLKVGDKTAWQSLFDDHSQEVRKGISASLKRREIPLYYLDEVEQRVWERCLVKCAEINTESNPETIGHWLRKVSYLVVQEFMYELRRDRKKLLDDSTLDWQPDDISLPPIGVVEDEDLSPENEVIFQQASFERDIHLQVMHEAIEEVLSPPHQEIMKLLLLGKSPQEISQTCGLETNSVHKVIQRSIGKIRGYMALKGLELGGGI